MAADGGRRMEITTEVGQRRATMTRRRWLRASRLTA